MNYQENRIIGYLISVLLAVGYYSFQVFQKYQEGSFDLTTISSSWGSVILIAIAVQIVLSIFMGILFSVIPASTRSEKNISLSDERDQLINLKADQISHAVFGVGFLIAMVTLAIGLPPLVMLNLIVYSGFGAGIVGLITKLYLYRRGF
ncbi:MAG: hypothetical protein IIB94_09305 [Candidatus Marinimicrobia bacterium]|nr:hypothetical protein [Candidatus Neomarinimicrobiota bacterium]